MDAIQEIQYIISLFCPGRCAHCGIWKHTKNHITAGELGVGDVVQWAKAENLKKINYIQLTGGEVQLSPKYIDVVKSLSQIHPHAYFHTNISGWYPQKHREVTQTCLKYIPHDRFRLDISLDGRAESYSKVRLVTDGFEKVFKTVNLLKEITPNLRFVFTIYKENYQDMEWVTEKAKEWGIGIYFEFAREATFLNNLGDMGASFRFSEEEMEYIELRLNTLGFLSRPDRALKWKRAKQVYRGQPLSFECYAGHESILIDPYGNVFPCLEMNPSLKMGNLYDYGMNLDALLTDSRAHTVRENIFQKKCQPCTMLCVHRAE